MDVTHPNEIEEAVRFLSQDDSIQKNGLNMLINNAGVAFKKQYLGNLTKEGISQQIDVNVVGAMLVTQAFLPLMRQAAAHTPKTKGPLPFRAAVINISSVLGSITENQSGGLYPYRISKAALNMFTKGAAVDLEKDQILSVALHPGWVQTKIGGPKAPLTANESVNGMMGVIQRLTKDNSGGFYDYEGKSIPW